MIELFVTVIHYQSVWVPMAKSDYSKYSDTDNVVEIPNGTNTRVARRTMHVDSDNASNPGNEITIARLSS